MSADPWSVPVVVAEIPDTGRHVDLAADANARAAIAKLAGVPGLPRLEAQFDLTRYGRDGVRVVGRVSGTVAQNCVLTLEPLENEVEEQIDLIFAPPAVAADNAEEEGAEIAEGDDPPELLRNGVVDLGAVATEFLLLGIDPYPRKPGSVFDSPKPREDPGSHPFAALAALKKPRPGQDG